VAGACAARVSHRNPSLAFSGLWFGAGGLQVPPQASTHKQTCACTHTLTLAHRFSAGFLQTRFVAHKHMRERMGNSPRNDLFPMLQCVALCCSLPQHNLCENESIFVKLASCIHSFIHWFQRIFVLAPCFWDFGAHHVWYFFSDPHTDFILCIFFHFDVHVTFFSFASQHNSPPPFNFYTQNTATLLRLLQWHSARHY